MFLFQLSLREREEVGKMDSGGSFSPSCCSSFPHECSLLFAQALPPKQKRNRNPPGADVQNLCLQVLSWMHPVISLKALMEQWAPVNVDQERGPGTAGTSLLRVCACQWGFYSWCHSNWSQLREVLTTKGASWASVHSFLLTKVIKYLLSHHMQQQGVKVSLCLLPLHWSQLFAEPVLWGCPAFFCDSVNGAQINK